MKTSFFFCVALVGFCLVNCNPVYSGDDNLDGFWDDEKEIEIAHEELETRNVSTKSVYNPRYFTSPNEMIQQRVLTERSIRDKFFKFFSGAKEKYQKVSLLPQAPIDFVRVGVAAYEISNTAYNTFATKESQFAFGMYTGTVACLNLFCSPVSLVYYSLLGLSYVEEFIAGLLDGTQIFKQLISALGSKIAFLTAPAKIMEEVIDLTVEPAIKTSETTTKTVFRPITFAYNVSLVISNKCTDVKTAILLVNLLTVLKDATDGTDIQGGLSGLNEYAKSECGALLENWPTISYIANKIKDGAIALGGLIGDAFESAGNEIIDFLVDTPFSNIPGSHNRKEIMNVTFNKKNTQEQTHKTTNGQKEVRTITNKEDIPGYGTPDIFTRYDPTTTTLRSIWSGIKSIVEKAKLLDPLLNLFQSVQRGMDAVLEVKFCIPFIPFGQLLEDTVKFIGKIGSKLIGAIKNINIGDWLSNKDVLKSLPVVGSLFNSIKVVDKIVEDIGKTINEGLEKAGKGIASAFSTIGSGTGNALKAVGNALSGLFGRKKRSLVNQWELEQSPNPEYIRKLNDSLAEIEDMARVLDRSARGLSSDLISKLADFVEGGSVCITPKQVLDFLSAAMDFVLKPFIKFIGDQLEPVINKITKAFEGILPNTNPLDALGSLEVDLLSAEDLVKFFDIFEGNEEFKKIYEEAKNLGPDCWAAADGYVKEDPDKTYDDVLCSCTSRTTGCSSKKRAVEEKTTSTSECRYVGIPYTGKVSVTTSGIPCQRWDSQSPHAHSITGEMLPDMNLVSAVNYCRNPNEASEQPWCYTSKANKEWEFCDIPLCEKACINSGSKTDGKWTITGSGRKCQSWDLQSPHEHDTSDNQILEGLLALAENFCRNPGNKITGPFCYTTDDAVATDVCNVPVCNSYSALRSHYKEYSFVNCDGNTYDRISNPDIKTCFEKCESNANCVGFRYTVAKCWLKTQCDFSSFVFTESADVYIKTEAPGYRKHENRICGATTIGKKKVTNLRECAEVCNNMTQCQGFEKDGTLCKFKNNCNPQKIITISGFTITTKLPSSTAYVKDGMKTYKKVSSVDCSGNDITSMTISTSLNEECMYKCTRNEKCIAYVRSGNSCIFKSKCEQLQKSSSSRAIYFKEVGIFSKYSDRNCPGNGLETKNDIQSALRCAYICRSYSNSRCGAFTYKLATRQCVLRKFCYPKDLEIQEDFDTYIMNQAPDYKFYLNKGCPGNDMSSHTVVNQVQCAEKCSNDPYCRAFSSRNTNCFIKHTCDEIDNLKVNTGQDTYIKHNVELFDKYTGKDCPATSDNENNLRELTESRTAEQCARKCFDNALCAAVVFSPSSATLGKCWLKLQCDVKSLSSNSGRVLYVKKDIYKYNRENNKDCSGNDIRSYENTTPEQCAKYCQERIECFGFATRTSDTKCWIKTKCKPGDFTSKSGTHAYYATEMPGFKLYKLQNCAGYDVERHDVDGIIQCAALCQNSNMCVAFVMNKNTFRCYLKHYCHSDILKSSSTAYTYILQANRQGTVEAAAGKPTWQSTTYNNKHSWYAVDGNTNDDMDKSPPCTRTDGKDDSWWSVYLGAKRMVHFVTIVNRGDCCGDRLRYFNIYVSNNKDPTKGTKNLCMYFDDQASRGQKLILPCDSPVEGSFVIIQRPGNDRTLTLCEVKVFVAADTGIDIIDIAKSKTTYQSSKYNQGDSSHAVDGNKGQHYFNDGCTETNFETNPWWSIYLGSKARTIRFVRIFNRGDCCGDRLQNFKVLGSTHQNPNVGTTTQCAWYTGTSTNGAVHRINCAKPVVAKYLVIQIIGNNKRLTLCEVNVYVEKKYIGEVAKGQATEQSSLYNQNGISSHAVDGNTGTHFFNDGCTETKTQRSPWWSVSLGGLKIVRWVTIYNRGDCCGGRLHDFRVLGSDDSNPNNGNTELCATRSGSLNNGQKVTVYCESPISAAFVVIKIPSVNGSTDRLTLCEVEVYATD